MKSAFSLLCLLASLQVQAFPHINPDLLDSLDKRQDPSAVPPFDAAKQLVSNTGAHAFKAPGPKDLRGPCPGLNVLANHGYIPRNGLATITQFVSGTYKVWGMAADLATILAAYGAALDGQLVSWSIGGDVRVGIGGAHNNYESDSSPLRGDLYQYGSNSDLQMSQFYELYNMQPNAATANYNLAVMKKFRGVRFNESIAKNPYFYYAPFSGVVVSQAAYIFIYRFMGNKSAENPTGLLNKEVLKSFMSVSGPEKNLTWTYGHERIPDNWYKRNDADQYSLAYLGQDQKYIGQGQEYVLQAGCNTGKVNSYRPINANDISAGAYGPASALTNPLCYGIAIATAMTQKIPILGPVANVVSELILPIQNSLNCITVPAVNESVSAACPGYSLYGGPTAKVAPGAIQG